MTDLPQKVQDIIKDIIQKQGVDKAVAYCCIRLGIAPIYAKEIVYELI